MLQSVFKSNELCLLEDHDFDRLVAGETVSFQLHPVRAPSSYDVCAIALAYPRRAHVGTLYFDQCNLAEKEVEFTNFLRVARFVRIVARAESEIQLQDAGLPQLHDWLISEFERGRRGKSFVQLNHGLFGGIEEGLLPQSFEQLQAHQQIKGPISECGCGVAGCGSEFAWINSDTCLALLRIIAGGTVSVALFPFEILHEFQDPRWRAQSALDPPKLRGDFDHNLWFRVSSEQFEALRQDGLLEVSCVPHDPPISEDGLVTRDDVQLRIDAADFSLEGLLAKSLLARVSHFQESKDVGPHAKLALESPFTIRELLNQPMPKPLIAIGRMNYAPKPCPTGLDRVQWTIEGRVIAEVVADSSEIVQLRILPRRPYGSKYLDDQQQKADA